MAEGRTAALLPEVLRWMDRLYVAAPGASLRAVDRRKALEVAALLGELRRARGGRRPCTLVDAAAGKAYVGLLAAQLVLVRGTGWWRWSATPAGPPWPAPWP